MVLFTRSPPGDFLDRMVYYLVETPDATVGIVDGWERDEHARPQALIVAQGWFGRRKFGIPVEKLIEIDHEHRRVVLARGAAGPGPKGPFQWLVELGREPQVERSHAQLSEEQARPVLCGVTNDRHAPAVVAVAARLARSVAAPLILANVTPARIPPGVSAAPAGATRLREEETEDAHELIDALLSGLVADTRVKRIVARGTPAETLEELAHTEHAQLLVIGTSGKGSFRTLVEGSHSQHLTSHAPCPIVIVPPVLRPELKRFDDSRHLRELTSVGGGRAE
jgi:nucleotide-binding universal stress UspA family protein